MYGLVNIDVTYRSGTPVYAPLSWDSVVTWIMGLAILPIAVAYFAGIYYLTKWKFRKLKMHDQIEYASVGGENNTLLHTTGSMPPENSLVIGRIANSSTPSEDDP